MIFKNMDNFFSQKDNFPITQHITVIKHLIIGEPLTNMFQVYMIRQENMRTTISYIQENGELMTSSLVENQLQVIIKVIPPVKEH